MSASSAKALVSVKNLRKDFGGRCSVFGELSLTIQDGEFVGIVGPSGCGKSTLLRLIAGLEKAEAGEIRVAGLSPGAAAHEMAFVFQDPTLLPWLTAEQNARLLLDLRKLPREQRHDLAAKALKMVHLESHALHYPRELSGGQRMRVSLARAFALSPKLLLLDEPFAALDELTRERLNEELLTLRAEQKWTALFVTHSISEAVFLSDRILVLGRAPGGLLQEFRVELPEGKRNADTRRSPAYLDLVAKISTLLRQNGDDSP